jgi:murein DD-endopeptidase MepM/ murein hydrolase activator NlpD
MFGEEGTGDSSPLMNDLKVPENGEFGNKASFRTQSHRGLDLVAPEGTKVFAIKGGKVEKSGVEGALGNMIRIRHADGTATVYGHLKSQLVGNGQEVAEGAQIGLSGNTGRSFGAHLHVALEDKDGGVSDPTGLVFGGGLPSGSSPGMSSASNPGKLFQTSGGSLFAGGGPGTGDSSGSINGGGGGGGTYYGGVNVTINVPQGSAVNETKLAREVKRILEDEEQLRMAVIR